MTARDLSDGQAKHQRVDLHREQSQVPRQFCPSQTLGAEGVKRLGKELRTLA
jgi:hypothetical protein